MTTGTWYNGLFFVLEVADCMFCAVRPKVGANPHL